MRHSTGRVLLLHRAGGAVVIIKHNAVKRLGRVVTQSLDGEPRLVLPPVEQVGTE